MWESIRKPLSANRRIVRNDYPPVKDTNKHSQRINFFYPISIYSLVFTFFFFLYLFLLIHSRIFYVFSFSFIYICCLYFYSLFYIHIHISSTRIFVRVVFINLHIIYFFISSIKLYVKLYEFENNFANTVIS